MTAMLMGTLTLCDVATISQKNLQLTRQANRARNRRILILILILTGDRHDTGRRQQLNTTEKVEDTRRGIVGGWQTLHRH